MEYLLKIPGKLPGLNDYIAAERTNRHKGAKMKADNGNTVAAAIRQCMGGVRIGKPVYMEYTWVEPNKRRDMDNISSFGRKVIQDALVQCCGMTGGSMWPGFPTGSKWIRKTHGLRF